MLAPGGRLYVTVPAYQALWSDEDVYAKHYRRYTASGLSAALRRAGFTVEHASYLFGFLPAPVFLFRRVPHLLGRGRPPGKEGVQDDHGGSRLTRKLLDGWLSFERSVTNALGGLPFGGSVIAVARKAG